MHLRRTFSAIAAASLALPAIAFAAPEPVTDVLRGVVGEKSPAADLTASDSLRHVQTIEYPALVEGEPGNYGTDSAFTTLVVDGVEREFLLAGSIYNGLHIVDITDAENPVETAVYDCTIGQGDVQVFTRDDRTYATFTDDGYGARDNDSECIVWARENAKSAYRDAGGQGTFIADITDPSSPQTVSFVPFPLGSHNQTVHPSGNYLYNSNSELVTNLPNAGIEIFDISDLANPKSVGTFPLPPVPASLGTDSHDITFSADGNRAYSAALSQTVIIDTTEPADPQLVTTIIDPTIQVHHQSDPITLEDPLLGERDFLIIEDEFAGAAGAEPTCPSGGVHVYDISTEQAPVKVGYWNLDDFRPAGDPAALYSCTAHVFQLHTDAKLMTISYYNGGVRVVDLSALVGVALGANGVGMKEVGFAYFPDSNSWSFKTNEIAEDGSFYGFSNDINRGLDIFHYTPADTFAEERGTGNDVWLSAEQAFTTLQPGSIELSDYTLSCLIPKEGVSAA